MIVAVHDAFDGCDMMPHNGLGIARRARTEENVASVHAITRDGPKLISRRIVGISSGEEVVPGPIDIGAQLK